MTSVGVTGESIFSTATNFREVETQTLVQTEGHSLVFTARRHPQTQRLVDVVWLDASEALVAAVFSHYSTFAATVWELRRWPNEDGARVIYVGPPTIKYDGGGKFGQLTARVKVVRGVDHISKAT